MHLQQINEQIISIARKNWEQSELPGPLKNALLEQYHKDHHAEQNDTEATPEQFFLWYYFNHIEHKTLDRILAGSTITGSITLPKYSLINIAETLERERIGQDDTVTLITRIQGEECTAVDLYLNDSPHVWHTQECEEAQG